MSIIEKFSGIILSFCIIFLLLEIGYANGYEISIYSNLPLYFWVLFISCYIGNLLLLLKARSNLIFYSIFFNILILDYIFTSLGGFRGYLLYNPVDPFYHIGRVIDLMKYHNVFNNIYPSLHIVIFTLNRITGIYTIEISKYFIQFIYISIFKLSLLMLSKYLSFIIFNRECTANNLIPKLTIVFSSPYLFNNLHLSLYPYTFSFLYFPLIIYLFLKSDIHKKYVLLYITLYCFLVFTYPTTSFAVFVSTTFALFLGRKGENKLLIYLMGVVLVTWITYNVITLKHPLQTIYTLFLFENAESSYRWAKFTTSMLSHLKFYEKMMFVIRMYIDSFFYIIMFVISSIIILRVRTIPNFDKIKIIISFTVISLLVELVSFFTGYVSTGRLLNLNVIYIDSPIILAVFTYYYYLKLNDFKTSAIYIFVGCVFILFILSIFSVYHSPYVLQPNWQVTQGEFQGSKWFYDNKEQQIDVFPLGHSPIIPYGYYGYTVATKRDDIQHIRTLIVHILNNPKNYNDLYTIINDSEGHYIVISQIFIISNKNPVLKESGLYTPPIYWRIQNFDLKVINLSGCKIYSNNVFHIYLVT